MQTIPKVDPKDDLCQQMWQRIYTSMQVSYFDLAMKTRLFDQLTQPMSLAELAEAKGFDPVATEPFLEVLRSMGLVELKDGKYVNHPQTSLFFSSGSALSHLPTYHGMMGMLNGILDNLETVLSEGGENLREELAGQRHVDGDEHWSKTARALLGGGLHQAQLLLPQLKAMPEWGSFKKMMDLGGGPGAYCMVFVSEHPHMRGVVFDQPGVAAEADKIAAGFGLGDRVTAQGGNYLNDAELGGGYDFIWSCATLFFAKDQLTTLFEKIHRALNPGGVFASYHPSLGGDGRESWEMVVGYAPHAMLGLDMRFYGDDIARAMLEAGFQSVQSKELRSIHGMQRLDLGRKAKD